MKRILALILLVLAGVACAPDQDHCPTTVVYRPAPTSTPVPMCSPSGTYTGSKSVSITEVDIRGTFTWDAGSEVTLLWYCMGGNAAISSVAYVSLASDGFCHTTITIPASNTLPDMSFDGEISGLIPDTDYVVLFECDGVFSQATTFRTL